MQEHDSKDTPFKVAKVTYLSAIKYADALEDAPQELLLSKLHSLSQYLKKKEEECRRLEEHLEEKKLKEEEKNQKEVLLEIVKYLGGKRFVQTIETLLQEMELFQVISIDPYITAKKSIEAASEEIEGVSALNSQIDDAFIPWNFSFLCRRSKEDALFFFHRNEAIPERYLTLLVLRSSSSLFKRISEECMEKGAFLFFSKGMPVSCLYQRVGLGVSGFCTSACKEKEHSLCPGCSSEVSRISKGFPKSMRSTTRVLCSSTKRLIPEGASVAASSSGAVFLLSSAPQQKASRRCYFV
ncbi:hypothetical protein NEFER03_0732 [Nematocida sp. LUAm3]|nr:hypothetical protein NEFER03_0732 [Nematocida sp. LUAm3]KAI5175191.1 hypothetical protein NEFER02_1152 [Nematocida sp. LUAm2]KAI5178137.1 hypothetical protein NEFER01_1315 [Nematocida sp. LUAm1]